MSYEARIAGRHLMSRKRSSVSVITFICTLGVVLGVAALVTVVSVAGGFQEEFRNKVLGQNGHLLVMKYGIDFGEYGVVMERARKVDGVLGATPFIFHEMMVSAGAELSGVLVKGVQPSTVGEVMELPRYMVEGRAEDLVDGVGPGAATILLGQELASSLGVGLGDPVTLVSPLRGLDPRSWGPRDTRPTSKTFRVAGLFRSGFHEYDSRLVYTHFKAIQGFFGQGDTVTGVEIRVRDIHATRRIGQDVRQSLGDQRYRVADWRTLRPDLDERFPARALGLLGRLAEGVGLHSTSEPPEALEGIAHVTMVREDGPFLDWRNAVQEAEFVPSVRGAGPMIQGQGELRHADRPAATPVRIRGHALDAGVTDYRRWLVAGSTEGMTRLAGPPGQREPAGLLLEQGFAATHGFKVGEEVTLKVRPGEGLEAMPAAIPVAYRVVGLVTPPATGGEATAWLDFTQARRMLSTVDAAGGVEVRLRDPMKAGQVATILRQRLGGHAYRTLDWREINQNLFKSLALQKQVLSLIVFAMVVVAMFNIVSTLFIIVVDKSREIAILKSMGASNGGVLRIFVMEGGAIGLVGTALGLLLGALACVAIGAVDYELDSTIYLIDSLPVRPVAREFVWAAGLAVLTSLVATLYPAAKAAALPPVEGLHRN